VTTAPGVVGSWDRSRIDQVLTNLMSNAVKYGRGEPIEVAVTADDEAAVVRHATTQRIGDQLPLEQVKPVLDGDTLLALQQRVVQVHVDDRIGDYAVRLVRATRTAPGLAIGAGTRAAIALVRAGRAAALLDGRDFVTPDDIKRWLLPTLRHRVWLSPDAQLEGRRVDALLAALADTVDAPRL
jgi:MoxR-like ATPase